MVYFPQAEQRLQVDLSCLTGSIRAWWYDPRNGKAHPAGEYPNQSMVFTSPIAGPDWVLGLDKADLNFSLPSGGEP